jgi:peptide/nickel transport system substrate-binding protein
MASTLVIDHSGQMPAPAPAVPGARPGGRIALLADAPPEHLDPQQVYIGTTLAVAIPFFHRTLTGYVESPDGGLTLVGDLATNAGQTTDGGKTWTYILRPGVSFEDGTPVTAQAVAHAVARSFSEFGHYGPQFLQEILDPGRSYQGPYETGEPAPGVHTPDERTIVFTLPQPHPEFPFLAAMTTTTPVDPRHDTRERYETTWLSTGPYRVRERTSERIVLEQNPHWDPASDPIRRRNVEEIDWQFGVDRRAQTTRLLAPSAKDSFAVATTDVAQEDIEQVESDPELMRRVLAGPTTYLQYIFINTKRVPALAIRRALNYAFDRQAYIEAAGGASAAEPSTTILAPLIPGYRHHDTYPAGPAGDPARAAELMAGEDVPELSYAFPDIAPLRKIAPVVKRALERAGFLIRLAPLDKAAYYSIVGRRDTDQDLIWGVWGPDFPDAAGVMEVLFRGDRIAEVGNMNLSYFDDPGITARLDRLAREPDRDAASAEYAAIDQELMAEHAPLIPVFYKRQFSMYGPRVEGLFLSSLYSFPNLTHVHVSD